MSYIVYTDGACSGNPGPGACASLILKESDKLILKESYKLTTNNRMELMAVLLSFSVIPNGEEVSFITDSKYITEAINCKWLESWEKDNFINKKNADLWKKILECLKNYKCSFTWVKGHSTDSLNNFVDKLCQKTIGTYPLLEDVEYEKKNL